MIHRREIEEILRSVPTDVGTPEERNAARRSKVEEFLETREESGKSVHQAEFNTVGEAILSDLPFYDEWEDV